MARETEMVKVYPSDEAVRAKVGVYEAFGWEVVGNQKITEKTGSYEGADGNYYNTTETYVQLTFSREKSSPWYKKVVELEEEYYAEVNKQNAVMAQEPQKAKYLGFFSFLLVFTPLMPITLPLLIVNIVRQSKANKKYKQEHDEWISKKYSVNDAAARRKDELLEQASELVNA